MDTNVLHQILTRLPEKVSDLHLKSTTLHFSGTRPADPGQDAQPDCNDTEFIAATVLEHNGRQLSNDLKECDASYSPGRRAFPGQHLQTKRVLRNRHAGDSSCHRHL
jgi:hypothetical protein